MVRINVSRTVDCKLFLPDGVVVVRSCGKSFGLRSDDSCGTALVGGVEVF